MIKSNGVVKYKKGVLHNSPLAKKESEPCRKALFYWDVKGTVCSDPKKVDRVPSTYTGGNEAVNLTIPFKDILPDFKLSMSGTTGLLTEFLWTSKDTQRYYDENYRFN